MHLHIALHIPDEFLDGSIGLDERPRIVLHQLPQQRAVGGLRGADLHQAHLISGALYSGEAGDNADPVVELGDEVTASCLHGWLQVHDLVGDVQLVTDHLREGREGGREKRECGEGR